MARVRNSASPLLTLAALVVAIAALHLAKEILLPLALAILLSFLLTPLANRLERLGLGRVFSVISVVGVTFVLLGSLGYVVTSQLVDLGDRLPRYQRSLVEKIREVRPKSTMFSDLSQTIEEVEKELTEDSADGHKSKNDAAEQRATRPEDGLQTPETSPGPGGDLPSPGKSARQPVDWWGNLSAYFRNRGDGADPSSRPSSAPPQPVPVQIVGTSPSPLNQVINWLGPLVAPLGTAAITVVLVIFIMLKREDQRNRLLQLFGSSHLHATTEALTDVTERVSKYLRMQFLINACYGLAVGVGLWFIGVESAVLWGVLSFSLRFLPYVGPWLSALMPLFISIAMSEGWTQPIMVIVWFTILELIVNNVAEPLLYGRSTGVSGVGVIVAAVFWTWIWGPVGLVLAMPLTVCVVVMARYIPGLRFLTILLGDEPAMTDQERIFQRLLAGDALEARKLLLQRLKDSSLVEVYDQVLIPALSFAERDRHAGLLHEEQENAVEETARDLVEELGEAADPKRSGLATSDESAGESTAGGKKAINVRVLCIPLRDEADETSALMLKQLLEAEGVAVEMTANEALTGELVDRVVELEIDVVVVSVLPPLPSRSSRLLCRRLRERHPELPILVGYWADPPTEEDALRLCAGDGEVLDTLAAMVERIRVIATHPRIADRAG